jgi:hypothetical protein
MPNQDRTPQNGTQGSSYLYDFGTSPNTRTAVSQKVRILAPVFGAETKALYQMGVVSSFSPSASARPAEEVRGIGFGDMIAELVPTVTAAHTASIERALLYLSNICQAVGYAAGVDGPVRTLAHHRWPFDIEMQLVFSSLADYDLEAANTGASRPTGGGFGQGVKPVRFPTVATGQPVPPTGIPYGNTLGHSAIITMYEACWMTSWQGAVATKDSGQIAETAEVTISDIHDFASTYGEFLPTGNDPTTGQLGSIRYQTVSSTGGRTQLGGTTTTERVLA